MASAQVLSGSRKQEHLEAGKRRLEEFRKKKAAEKSRKAVATSLPNAYDTGQDNGKPLETEQARITNSNGAGTSEGPGGSVETNALSIISVNTQNDIGNVVEPRSFKDADVNNSSISIDINSSADELQQHTGSDSYRRFNEVSERASRDSGNYAGSQSGLPYRSLSEQFISLDNPASQDSDISSSQSSGLESNQLKPGSNFSKDLPFSSPISHVLTSSSNFSSPVPQTKLKYGSMLDNGGNGRPSPDFPVESIRPNIFTFGSTREVENHMDHNKQLSDTAIPNFGHTNFSSLANGFPSVHTAATEYSKTIGFGSDINDSSYDRSTYMPTSETQRRSRPSFLDSLNLGTTSQPTNPYRGTAVIHNENSNSNDEQTSFNFQIPISEKDNAGSFSSLKPKISPSLADHPMKFASHSTDANDLPSFYAERNFAEEPYHPKQDENFSALEQHIEDLTQEKYALQRALEASQAFADSLASENSSLTDNYNQQRGVVNQLKSDMEKLQQEIKEHLVELESVKNEYSNAQLECNAADERAKLLASEVIGLEEKALRLRSNELKLERQLEDMQSQIVSQKKRMSSLEKDRQDLRLTIEALQEEKKLLQSKLWKASASGKSADVNRISDNKKDMSTSTDDLVVTSPGISYPDAQDGASVVANGDHSLWLLSNLEDLSISVPPEQLRMIHNINALISELALEKEELIHALASESSECLKLKDLNKELSRKLEFQTQRLELLTAQSMMNDGGQRRTPDSRVVHENPTYADEGDEVVERVLGWIMKLFPGGPSKRRTSKVL